MYKTKNIESKAKSLGNQFGFLCWKIANRLKKMMTRGSVEKCIKRMELKFSMNCAYMVQNTVQLTYLRVSLSVCLFLCFVSSCSCILSLVLRLEDI